MGWPKGTPRPPGAGRKKGTLNRKTADLVEICKEEGIDPFRALLRLAVSPNDQIKIQALKELCQYIYPKRKALEHSIEPSNEELKNMIIERMNAPERV